MNLLFNMNIIKAKAALNGTMRKVPPSFIKFVQYAVNHPPSVKPVADAT